MTQLKLKEPALFDEKQLKSLRHLKMDNIRKSWDEFQTGKLIVDSMPFKGIVELTQNCNFKCVMCPQAWEPIFQKYNPDLNMPMDVFAKIADEFFPYASFVDLRGFGETTILPYWPELVDYLQNHPYVHWHLVTNLSLPRAQTWDKMISQGFSLGFSCDGATQKTFESIRARSRFYSILDNLGVVMDSIRRHQMGLLYFISTIQKSNLHELRQIVELAARYSVPEVQFKMIQGEIGVLDATDPEFIQSNVNGALDAAFDLGVRVTFNDWLFTRHVDPAKVARAASAQLQQNNGFFLMSQHDPEYWASTEMQRIYHLVHGASQVSVQQKCFKPFSFTYINYKAEMGTCNHMMFPDVKVMGDLKTQSIREIWNGPDYQDFRQQLLLAKPKDHRCQWCFKHRLDD